MSAPTPYYQDEHVTLYHGNCLTEHREWLDADVLVTDPPYGMRLGSGIGTYRRGVRSTNERTVAGDDSTAVRDAALDMWGKRPAVVFGTWKIDRPDGDVRHRVIWHKAGMTSGSIRAAVMTQDEEVYFLGSGWRASAPPLMSVITTRESRSHAVKDHPTPKPIGLMETLIDRCPPGIIADPFAGSGATLIAARNLGRKAIGVELEERYCEVIAKRLGQGAFDLTGM